MGAAIKTYCKEKIRNWRGAITGYKLITEYGEEKVFNREETINLLKDSRYEIMNLQLDTMGRIVDKAIAKEKESINKLINNQKSTDKQIVFEDCYKYMIMNYGTVIIYKYGNFLFMSSPLDRLRKSNNICGFNNIDELEREFETYLLQRHNFKASKMKIINQYKDFVYIVWSTDCIKSYHSNFKYIEDDKDESIARDKVLLYDNINNFNITYQVNFNNPEKYMKVATIYDPATGRVVENAFCGAIVYNKNVEEAVDVSKDDIEEIEETVKKLSRQVTKKNNNTGKVTLAKSNNNSSVSLAKPDNRKRGFFRKIIDFFNMFKR